VLVAVTGMSIVTTSPVFFAGAFGAQISADLGIGPAALGGLAAVFFGVTGISATHLGRLADRLRGQTAGRWAVVASVVSLAVAGVSGSYPALVASMAIGGLGNGLGGPTANMIVADRIPSSAMGVAFGVKQSAVPAATLLGGLAIPLFVTSLGWRPTIIGAAVLACAVLAFVPDAASRERTGGKRPGLDRTTLAVGAAFLFGIAAATSMSTLLSTFAVGAGLTATFAGLTLSAGSVGAIGVRIVSGRSADRGAVDPAGLTMWMMIVGTVGYGLIATQLAWGVAGGAFMAYAIGWGWSGLLVLNLVRAHPEAPGSATGVVLTGAAIGGMIGPASIGWIAEHVGFPTAWILTGCLSLVAAAAARLSGVFLLRSTDRRADEEPN
jgi:MFS family permease